MALTQISTQGIKDGTITGTDLATNVDLVDNQKLRFGTGNDLQIYHSGIFGIIHNPNDNLKLISDRVHLQSNGGEPMLQAIENGAVELYHDNVKRFETQTGGAAVTGGLNVSGNIALPDNSKFIAGTGDDLQIYHNGSNSYLRNSTGIMHVGGPGGNLLLEALGDVRIVTWEGESMIEAKRNGAVELYFDNSNVFQTISGGADINGVFRPRTNNASTLGHVSFRWADVISNSFDLPDSGKLKCGNNDDLQIFHNGTDSSINNNTGNLIIGSANNLFLQNTSGEKYIKATANGAVELYYDNSLKFNTKSTGFEGYGGQFVFYGDEGGASQLLIYADEGDDLNDRWRVMAGGSSDFEIGTLSDGSWDTSIKAFADGSVELYHNDSKKLETTSSGAIVTGNLGIGTTSPATAMHIKNADDPVTITLQNSDSNTPTDSGGEIIFKGTKANGDPIFLGGVGGRRRNQASDVTGYLALYRQDGDGSNNAVEGMRIDHNGNVGIGTTSPDRLLDVVKGGTNVSRFQQTTNNQGEDHTCITLRHAAATSGQNGVGLLFQNTGGTTVGKIDFGHSTTQYRTSSDYRLKENAVTISDGITRLKTLKPYRFNFKIDPSITVDGFFAHEVTAVPEAISGIKDEVDADNKPVYQGIDQSKLVPLLVAALQEAIGRIEVLEAK